MNPTHGPVTRSGVLVRLEPLQASHAGSLAAVGLRPDLWRWQLRTISSEDDMRSYVEDALDEQRRGLSLPFVIIDQHRDEVIGSTAFMNIAPEHRRMEIGASWLTPTSQRTGANVEAKLLMLTFAFDTVGVHKIVFKTETSNTQSQTAIVALGAVEEGTFRQHLISESGRSRDMVYFSILESEFLEQSLEGVAPEVKRAGTIASAPSEITPRSRSSHRRGRGCDRHRGRRRRQRGRRTRCGRRTTGAEHQRRRDNSSETSSRRPVIAELDQSPSVRDSSCVVAGATGDAVTTPGVGRGSRR